jgi:peptidoglycan/LPS O-acetylase OafA/YrhL
VVLYHAEIGFASGFIGVDVFFVLSGYIVTLSHLGTTSNVEPYSATDFIVRRLRRILPAALFTVVSVAAVSLLFFSPFGEYQEIWKSAIPSLFFSSNIFYGSQDVYEVFNADPFRHFWSLAVEEQFYFLYFVMLSLGARLQSFFKVRLSRFLEVSFWLVGLTSLTALVISEVSNLAPVTWLSYFSPVGRLWELSAGVLLACQHRRSDACIPIKPALLQFVSLSILATIFLSLSSPSEWPNISTLLPTLATLLFLDAGRRCDISAKSWMSRLLVDIGDHSYGIYLLHWPILVLAQRQWGTSTVTRLSAILISFALAYLMKRCIEDVFVNRGSSKISPRRTLVSSTFALILTSALLVGFSALASTGLGLNARVYYDSENSTWMARSQNGEPDQTILNYTKGMSFASRNGCGDALEARAVFCLIDIKLPSRGLGGVALVGDSQSRALSDGFVLAAQDFSSRWISWSSGCPFVKEAFPNERDECKSLNEQRLSFILRNRPEVVVISNLASRYLEPDLLIDYYESERFGQLAPQFVYLQAISETARELTSVGIKVVVVLDIPIPPSYGGRPTLLNSDTTSPYVLKHSLINERLMSYFEARSLIPGVSLMNPSDSLCEAGLCRVLKSGQFLYADNDHLSPAGSLLVAESLREAILNRGSN